MDGEVRVTDGEVTVAPVQMNSIDHDVGTGVPPNSAPVSQPEKPINGIGTKSGSKEILDDSASKESGKDRHSSGASNDSKGKPLSSAGEHWKVCKIKWWSISQKLLNF
jgi:hypothetical protein